MALFRCASSSSGGGATITVTYNSSFYNKTMTCSNGIKTYTKTTTSSGSTEFNVSDEGTWTITCNGISRTVYVTLNYSTAMAITKTVTVYGAAGATISFTDTIGSKTVTLDNSGQGSVSITFIPPSQSITFTDTDKAKNPNNLSQNYSKSIAITESTTSIKVMPNNALYWWGYENGIEDNGFTINYSGTYTAKPVTHNSNTIKISGTGTSWKCLVNTLNKITGTLSVIASSTGNNGYEITDTKQMSTSLVENSYDSTMKKYTYTLSNKYFAFGYWTQGNHSADQTLYAMWYE